MTRPDNVSALVSALRGVEVVELGQVLGRDLPSRPGANSFQYDLFSPHDPNRPGLPGQSPGSTSASDRLRIDLHCGTHMDSLSHIAVNGRLSDGTVVVGRESPHEPMEMSVSMIRPLIGPGVMLDFAGLLGVEEAPGDYLITAEEIVRCESSQGVECVAGSVVLIHTGRDRTMCAGDAYFEAPFAGIDESAARLLRQRGVVAVGSDTLALESSEVGVPLEPHVELLWRGGIFILEGVDLRELVRRRCHQCVVVVVPLRIEGGTGSPVNPLALVPSSVGSG